MATIKICFDSQTLEMTQRYANKASRFGSEEYNALQTARRDYPDFKVVIVSPKAKKNKSNEDTKKNIHKGLTYEYMEKYIATHDEDGSVMDAYLLLRGKSNDAVGVLAESASYKEIREWFLKTFPAIAEFHKKRADLLANGSAKSHVETVEESGNNPTEQPTA